MLGGRSRPPRTAAVVHTAPATPRSDRRRDPRNGGSHSSLPTAVGTEVVGSALLTTAALQPEGVELARDLLYELRRDVCREVREQVAGSVAGAVREQVVSAVREELQVLSEELGACVVGPVRAELLRAVQDQDAAIAGQLRQWSERRPEETGGSGGGLAQQVQEWSRRLDRIESATRQESSLVAQVREWAHTWDSKVDQSEFKRHQDLTQQLANAEPTFAQQLNQWGTTWDRQLSQQSDSLDRLAGEQNRLHVALSEQLRDVLVEHRSASEQHWTQAMALLSKFGDEQEGRQNHRPSLRGQGSSSSSRFGDEEGRLLRRRQRTPDERSEHLARPELEGGDELPRSNRNEPPPLFSSEPLQVLSENSRLPKLKSPTAGSQAGEVSVARSSVISNIEREKWFQSQTMRVNHALEKTSRWARCVACARGLFIGVVPEDPPETSAARFVQSTRFSASCTILILMNTIFIGYESNEEMHFSRMGQDLPPYFRWVNRTFAVAFSLELLVRIAMLRVWWLVGPDSKWNFFDAFLVLTSVLEEVSEGINISFVRIFRIFRIVRVARIIRLVRFFRELRRMVCAIVSCLASLAWAFLLLMLIMYVFSIFLLQGAGAFIKENPTSEFREVLEFWYTDLPTTVFSLLLAISGGNDWWDMLEPLVQISEMYRVVFAFYVVFVVFGVLNVLTGIFLESATEFVDKDLVIQAQMMRADLFMRQMGSLFKQFDTDHAGYCNWEQFRACIDNDEVRAYLASLQLDNQDAWTLFTLLDRDGQQKVNINEFIQGCLRLKGQARSIDTACLMTEVGRISQRLSRMDEELGKVLEVLHEF